MTTAEEILRKHIGFSYYHKHEYLREDILSAMEEYAEEKAGQVDTIVSVPELLSLAEMVREQTKVDKMLGDNGILAKQREEVYNECAGFIERLAKGDKSIIEKM